MQVYSSSLPFIHPRTSADLSHSQAMLHNLYGLGRTNILKHTLQPTEASLTLRLRSLWAHTYARSFSSLQEAKDYLHSKLIMIHPFAQKAYETEIAQIQTIEGIQNLAKRLFNLSDFATSKTVKPLFTEINKNLSQRSPEAATTRQNISKFWRTLISSKEPLETLHSIASEKLDTFPRELREQYAYILQERTIEEVKARAESHLKSLDTDIARLYPTEQERIIECLRSTWNFIKEYKDFSSREEVLDAMRSRLSAIQLPNIPTLYLQDAALSKTVESMQNRAERFLHDLESIKYPCNLTSTSSGATAYPKLINWERFEKITGFMKHLGVREEMDHNLVYNFFLSQPIQGFRFCVPKGAMFEFTSDPKYTSPFGKQIS
ncbi:MAG: hypothetical protein K2X08_02555, partial [Chlamydiales bacterium]|nr:hypothetical protein [Chlamydiales bacterium]